jgi:hypothetical protein
MQRRLHLPHLYVQGRVINVHHVIITEGDKASHRNSRHHEAPQVSLVTWSVFLLEVLIKPRNCNSATARVNRALNIS